MRLLTGVLSLTLFASGFAAYGKAQTTTMPNQTKQAQAPKTDRGPGAEIGSGSGDIGRGAGKGVGSAAAGTGKGVADVATLHPVKGAEDVGKGGAKGVGHVAAGAGKGTGKVVKGTGKAIGKIF